LRGGKDALPPLGVTGHGRARSLTDDFEELWGRASFFKVLFLPIVLGFFASEIRGNTPWCLIVSFHHFIILTIIHIIAL